MPLIDWVASLTPSQRDAIRTIATVIGGAAIPIFGFILTWGRRGVKRLLTNIVSATHVKDFEGGRYTSISVAELARRASHNTEETLRNTRETKDTTAKTFTTTQELRGEFRSEITDLVNDPRAGTVTMRNRHRLPTTDIPSLYIPKDPEHE